MASKAKNKKSGKQGTQGQRGVPDGLRTALERTFAATTKPATDTAERARGIADELTRRGQEARDASAGFGHRIVEAIQDMRIATTEDLKGVGERISALEKRIRAMEGLLPGGKPSAPAAKSSTAKQTTAKKTTAKKAPAKKTTAKKAPAKKTTAKKASPARRAKS